MFVLAPFLLKSLSKVIVEAGGHLYQFLLYSGKFLYSYGIFNTLGQSFIKLSHFSPFVPCYSCPVLSKSGQIFWH
jgi:hypothetical protein